MALNKIILCVAAFSACLLIGIACGQDQSTNTESVKLNPLITPTVLASDLTSDRVNLNPVITPAVLSPDQPVPSCPFFPFYAVWAFYKDGSQRWCLDNAEKILKDNGFTILYSAENRNVYVMGRRNNPDVIITVVCTWLGQKPTSVVIYSFSPDENTAQTAAAQVRDQLKNIVSLEGDVALNPVQG